MYPLGLGGGAVGSAPVQQRFSSGQEVPSDTDTTRVLASRGRAGCCRRRERGAAACRQQNTWRGPGGAVRRQFKVRHPRVKTQSRAVQTTAGRRRLGSTLLYVCHTLTEAVEVLPNNKLCAGPGRDVAGLE